jgi:hypothetical protein
VTLLTGSVAPPRPTPGKVLAARVLAELSHDPPAMPAPLRKHDAGTSLSWVASTTGGLSSSQQERRPVVVHRPEASWGSPGPGSTQNSLPSGSRMTVMSS